MKELRGTEYFWGVVAHFPLITLIWFSYVTYYHCVEFSIDSIRGGFQSAAGGLPLLPMALTLCALPISLAIMHFKKMSLFVYRNAESACHFNIWLLKCYGIAFVGTGLGLLLSMRLLSVAFGLLIALLSTMSLVQAFIGVYKATRGRVFYYWYPGRRLK